MVSRRQARNQPQRGATFDLKGYRHPKAYVRVSTEDQAEEGTSIEFQIRQLKSFAAAYGVTLDDQDIYIDDGWSGKDLDRPAMRSLRHDARLGLVDCVLVTKLDRFSRNLRDTVNLCLGEWQDEAPEGRHVALKSVTEPFDTHSDFGRMVFGLLAMFAEFERRRIAERTWAGKVSRAESGRNAGQRPPYGFGLVPGPDGRASYFALVPSEAAVIRRIADLYLQQFGYEQIAARLNSEGLRYRHGVLWQTQHIARILGNPIIAGTYAYGRKAYQPDGSVRSTPPDEWILSSEPVVPEAILPQELFDRIQNLKAQRRTGGREMGGQHLLTGILRCARCGAACGAKANGAYRYYRCLRRKESGAAACSQPTVRADYLDDQVLTAIRALLLASGDALSARVQASSRAQRAGLTRALADLAAEEQSRAQLRSNYVRWLEVGQLRPESVQQRLDELAAQAELLRERRCTLQAELRRLQAAGRAFDLTEKTFSDTWAALDPRERKQLVALLIDRIELDGRRVEVTWAHNLHAVSFRPVGV